jgi:succinylarginine dihydrolase
MATDLSLTVFISQKTGWECGLSAATSKDPMWTSTAATTAISSAPAAKVTINQCVAVREAAKSDMPLAPMN